ncbi:MAG: ABC transporter permease, partial [Gemmataceae bacterium]|nr:ABC transporter permease [Gemmataceae bacterium]
TADLTSWEIIGGKLCGRAAPVLALELTGLPLIALVAGYGGLSPSLLLAMVLVSFPPIFALGAASLLASVWVRQTRDAVVSVYVLGAATAGLLLAMDKLDYLIPLAVLEPGWGNQDLGELGRRLLLFTLGWGSVGGFCLMLAVGRLRRAYRRQLEVRGRPPQGRGWRIRRPGVPDEPISWKERHIEGVAPLDALRLIPRALGLALVVALTLGSSAFLLWSQKPARMTDAALLSRLARLDAGLLGAFPDATAALELQGGVAFLVASLLVGIRCSGAITGERERQTWEALLVTPLSARQLIRGKLWGILGASLPYLLAYAGPALPLALLAGLTAFWWTAVWLGLSGLAMWFLGAVGLWCSVHARSSWRSLLATLGFGYLGGFLLYCVALPLIGIAYSLIAVALVLLDYSWQTQLANRFAMTANLFFALSAAVLVAIFLLVAWFLLRSAQKYVAQRERTRYAQREPTGRSRQRGARPRSPSRSNYPVS